MEALITSLRTHLTRLTTELASHQELLTSLRHLRDADAKELRAHSGEILQLREEVQRLAGEVEVLRGVVEEGLKERRASREMSRVEIPEEERGMSHDLDEEEDEDEDDEEEDGEELEPTDESAHSLVSDDEPEPFDPVSIETERAADRTMRTDFATLGESTNSQPARMRRVGADELNDITAELEERRANLSGGALHPPPRSPPPQHNPRTTMDDTQDIDAPVPPARSTTNGHTQTQVRTHPAPSTSRPSAPTPTHAARRLPPAEPETPFPQIRGAHLERLFFSAPEHNARTCTVCFRRRDREQAHTRGGLSPGGWSRPEPKPTAVRRSGEGAEGPPSDEGYEGSEGERPGSAMDRDKQVQIEALYNGDARQWRATAKKHGLPPQTVVARVIRELEDDFTHYKRYGLLPLLLLRRSLTTTLFFL